MNRLTAHSVSQFRYWFLVRFMFLPTLLRSDRHPFPVESEVRSPMSEVEC
jgi:hypothetical protein